MADSLAIRAFLGERFEDLMDSGRRAVRQAGKSLKRGTRYTFRAALSGTVDAELVESQDVTSGLELKLMPGPLIVQNVTGSLSGGFNRNRSLDGTSNGGLTFWAEIEVIGAEAADDEPA